MMLILFSRLAQLFKHIALSWGNLRFDSRAGHIQHSVVNGSPPLRRFFEAVLRRRKVPKMDPATRYKHQRNTVSGAVATGGLLGDKFCQNLFHLSQNYLCRKMTVHKPNDL